MKERKSINNQLKEVSQPEKNFFMARTYNIIIMKIVYYFHDDNISIIFNILLFTYVTNIRWSD